jgi:hypothetical protein
MTKRLHRDDVMFYICTLHKATNQATRRRTTLPRSSPPSSDWTTAVQFSMPIIKPLQLAISALNAVKKSASVFTLHAWPSFFGRFYMCILIDLDT